MKILEKLKNTFFEEEYIDVEEKEVVARKVEPKETKKELKKEIKKEERVVPKLEEIEEELIKEERK